MTDPAKNGQRDLHDRNVVDDLPPILAGLCRGGDNAADELLQSLRSREFPRDHVIFAEGEPGDDMYVVRSGKVKIGRTVSNGKQTLLGIIAASEVFGDLSVFDPGPRAVTATTLTEVTVQSMSGAAVRRCVIRRPDLAEQVLRGLARQQRLAEAMLIDRLYLDVPSRLAKTLLELAQRFGTPMNGGWQVRHDLTQQEFAQYVGACRETVNKTLAGFARRGWVRLEGSALRIVDPASLAGRVR